MESDSEKVASDALRKRPPTRGWPSRIMNGTLARASDKAARAPATPAPTIMMRSECEEEEVEEEEDEEEL